MPTAAIFLPIVRPVGTIQPTSTPTPIPEQPKPEPQQTCDETLTLDDVLKTQEDFRAGRITVEELMATLRCWDEQRGF